SGVFDAEVYPDLPPARTVAGLVGHYVSRAKQAALRSRHRGGGKTAERETVVAATATATATTPAEWGGRSALGGATGRYVVRSVPVQTSRKENLRHRLAAAAGVDSEGVVLTGAGAGTGDGGAGTGRPADALLLLSGSHPGRRLPFAKRFLPDVYDELRLATSMRNSGHLPKDLAFWAVANPLTEAGEAGVDGIRRKVDLGAEVILTQPPLAWKPFERWLQGVTASGALEGTASKAREGSGDGSVGGGVGGGVETPTSRSWSSSRSDASGNRPAAAGATLLIGMPVITSRRGLQFWLDLCGVSDRGLREEVLNGFESPTADAIAAAAAAAAAVGEPAKGGGGGESSFVLVEGVDAPFGQAWFETTMSRLKDLGGDDSRVAGVHVMAPGSGPRERARALASTGVFGERRE
ncbi:unnamed protein product, partial [Laminaria digitata]